MSGTTINLTDPVWAGGSGDLSSNWITGYAETDTDGLETFDSWVMGTPGPTATVEFLSSLSTPVQNDTSVGAGGTLDGILNTGTVIFDNPTTYTLNGDLSAGLGNLDVGTVVVGGKLSFSMGLDQAGELDIVGGGSLFVGATPSSGGIALVGGPAVLTVSGAGSTLTDQGDLATSALSVTDGAVVTVGGNELGLTGGTTVTVDADSAMEIGGTANLKTGTIVIDPGDLAYLGQGSAQINGAIENNGTIENGSGAAVGTLTLAGAIAGSGTLNVLANQMGTTTVPGVSDIVLDGAVGNGQTVNFSGPSGLLTVGDLNNFDALVTGFQQGDTIDLVGIAANGTVYDAATGVLTLTESVNSGTVTNVGTLTFKGLAAGQAFQLSSDGAAGTDITIGPGTLTPAPTIVAPGSIQLTAGTTNPVGGISITETPLTDGETFTAMLMDTNGTLAANTSAAGGGGTITASNGGKTLTIVGSLSQVNADLSSLTDYDPSTAADTLKINASDSNGGNAVPVSVSLTTPAGPPPPVITVSNPGTVERSQTIVIATVAPGIAGDTLSLNQTAGAGTVMLVSAPSGSGKQVVYTAPASVPTSKVDTVGYTILDSDGATATSPPTSVQLDAGPSLKAQAPTTIEQGQTTVIGQVTPGLKSDTLTMTVTETTGGGLTLNSKGQIVYTAPPTTKTANYKVSYTITDQYKDATVGGQATLVVDGGPVITPETPATISQGQTTDIGLVTPGISSDTLTLNQTGGTGKLSLGPAQANGSRQVIYTAPAAVGTSTTDKVSYTVTDQHKDDMATGSASVQLAATTGSQTITGPAAGSGNINPGNGNFSVALSGSTNAVTLGNGNSNVSGGQNDNTITGGNGNYGVSLSGNGNTVALGNGNETVTIGGGNDKISVGSGNSTISVGGGGNTITAGNGNDTITLAGSGSTVHLGNGSDTVHGGSGDTIDLAATKLTLYGTAEMVFLGSASATVNDFSTGLDLKIGPTAGADVLANFAADPSGVVDLIGGIGGFTTPAGVVAALKSDGHGGTLLSFGAGGSLDFTDLAPSALHAANFKIG